MSVEGFITWFECLCDFSDFSFSCFFFPGALSVSVSEIKDLIFSCF